MDFDSLQDDSETQSAPTAQTAQAPQTQSKPMMFDDLKEDSQTPPTDFDSMKEDPGPYESPAQKLGTYLEGTAQGFAGPLATLAEQGLGKLGVDNFSDQEIKGRREANPGTFLAGEATGLTGGLFTGTGEAALLGKLVGEAKGITTAAKIGSGALKGFIQNGLIQGGNEISKGLLGQGDPTHPVSKALFNMGAAGLFGGLFGGAAQGAVGAANLANETKIAKSVNNYAMGFGQASKPAVNGISAADELPEEILNSKGFKLGQAHYESLASGDVGKTLAGRAARYSVPLMGISGHIPGGPVVGTAVGVVGEHLLEKGLNSTIPRAAQKYFGPAMLRMASEGQVEGGVNKIINYCSNIARGENLMGKGIDSIFKQGAPALDLATSEQDREKTKSYIENNGIQDEINNLGQSTQNPGYAAGGPVFPQTPTEPNPIEQHFPEQNILLTAAKARIAGYLNSNRPIDSETARPYDTQHKDKQKERDYNDLVDLANKPAVVFNHIKNGTLLPKHMKAMSAMYPELTDHLQQQITQRLLQDKVDGEKKPPYKVRQSLSLFLGNALDSSLTPQGMMAAQAVFINQKAQQQQAPKKSTSSLGNLGKSTQSADQSREQRLNKS